MPHLSKSRYMAGLQCAKRLWLEIHCAEGAAPLDDDARYRMQMGARVGEYARLRFDGGVLIAADHHHLATAIRATQKAVTAGAPVIYEATAAFDHALSQTDILCRVPRKKNEWDLYEVKSASGVKKEYLDDVAFQRHCFEGAGFGIRKTYLMHVNTAYVRHGAIDPQALLVASDVTETVLEKMKGIRGRVDDMVGILKRKTCPKIDPGKQCLKPHACPFFERCNGGSPDDVKRATRKRNPAVVNTQGLRAFLETLEYPLYFFDFETIDSAVPLFDDSRPYEKIPFQFSLHVQKMKDGPVVHHEFLHDQKNDPRQPLIQQMIALLGKTGSIVAYHMSFEKMVIKKLAADFPKHSKALLALLPRFADLIVPFKKGLYVHDDFHGSASLKSVLPVMVPSLSYADLEIQEGVSASRAYENWMIGELSDTKWKRIYPALLKYCELDTVAMVRIYQELWGVCG